MAKNPTKRQKEELAEHKATNKVLDERIKKYEEMLDAGIELTNQQRKHLRELKLTNAEAKSTSDVYKDLSGNVSQLMKKESKMNGLVKDRLGMGKNMTKLGIQQLQVLKERVANGDVNSDLAEDLLDTTNNILSGEMDINKAKSVQKNLQNVLKKGLIQQDGTRRELNDSEKESVKNAIKLNKLEAERQKIQQKAVKAGGTIKDAMGETGDLLVSAVTNPFAFLLKMMQMAGKDTDDIGKKFGAMGVTKFRDDIVGVKNEVAAWGMGMDEVLTSTEALNTEYGISMDKSIAMSKNVADLAKSTGIGVETSAKLMGHMTEIEGMSAQAAMETLKMADSLAVANGVAPGVVLKDMANSTEAFAKFGAGGAKNLMRAAIAARKLGIDLNKVAGTAEAILNFQDSLNAEVEASMILGRNVNLQKARELAMSNDLEGLAAEIRNIVGDEAQWNKMNVFQRKALARAVGMEVRDLDKVVRKEKEQAKTLQEMTKTDLAEIIPTEAMSDMSQKMAEMQQMFMKIAEELGPPLMQLFNDLATPMMQIVGSIAQFIIGLNDAVGIVPLLTGYLGMALTKSILLMAVNIAASYSKGASMPPGPWTIALLAAMPIFVGGLVTAITALAGDAAIPASHKGGPTISTREGGLIRGTNNDEIIMAPGIVSGAGAGGGTGAGIGSLISELRAFRRNQEKQMSQHNDTWGTKGKGARNIGKHVSRQFLATRR